MISPHVLKKGDHIRLVCPASALGDPLMAEKTKLFLESKGFRVSFGRSIFKRDGFLAGDDGERLLDLEDGLRDDSVSALFCIRGGYGSGRLLKALNFNVFKKTKKILLGFSDITALQLAVLAKAQLQSYHGPVFTLDRDKNFDSLMRIAGQRKNDILLFPKEYLHKATSVIDGDAEGVLYGGNLSIVCSLLGTSFFPKIKEGILFLEDIHEPPYRIDRMFTQLENAGIFSTIRGVLLGQFTKCKGKGVPSYKHIAFERLSKYKIPILAGLPFGHERRNFTIPQGGRVSLSTRKKIIRLI